MPQLVFVVSFVCSLQTIELWLDQGIRINPQGGLYFQIPHWFSCYFWAPTLQLQLFSVFFFSCKYTESQQLAVLFDHILKQHWKKKMYESRTTLLPSKSPRKMFWVTVPRISIPGSIHSNDYIWHVHHIEAVENWILDLWRSRGALLSFQTLVSCWLLKAARRKQIRCWLPFWVIVLQFLIKAVCLEWPWFLQFSHVLVELANN